PGVFAGQEPPSRTCAPKVPPAPVGADSWHVSTPSPKPLRPAQGACQGRDAVAGAGRIGGRDRKALSGRGDKSAPGFSLPRVEGGEERFREEWNQPLTFGDMPRRKGGGTYQHPALPGWRSDGPGMSRPGPSDRRAVATSTAERLLDVDGVGLTQPEGATELDTGGGDVPFDGDRALGPLPGAERERVDLVLVHAQAPAGVLLGAVVGDDREVERVDLDVLVAVVFNGHEHAGVSTAVVQDAGVELSGLGSQNDLRFLLRFFLGGFLFLGGFGVALLCVRVRLGTGGTVVGAAPGQDGHASPEQEQHEEQATAAKTELLAGGHSLLLRAGVARRGHLGLVH